MKSVFPTLVLAFTLLSAQANAGIPQQVMLQEIQSELVEVTMDLMAFQRSTGMSELGSALQKYDFSKICSDAALQNAVLARTASDIIGTVLYNSWSALSEGQRDELRTIEVSFLNIATDLVTFAADVSSSSCDE